VSVKERKKKRERERERERERNQNLFDVVLNIRFRFVTKRK